MHFYTYCILTLLSGDIETNPGPKLRSCDNGLSIFHWNLNSLTAHNYAKLTLMESYNAIHQYDIICLSETYLNSTISNDDCNISIPGYTLLLVDHPNNIKQGGVCILQEFTSTKGTQYDAPSRMFGL